MNKFQGRYQVVLILFFLVAIIYLIQLLRIQVIDDNYKFSANNNALRYDVLTPVRGLIFDRNNIIFISREIRNPIRASIGVIRILKINNG